MESQIKGKDYQIIAGNPKYLNLNKTNYNTEYLQHGLT